MIIQKAVKLAMEVFEQKLEDFAGNGHSQKLPDALWCNADNSLAVSRRGQCAFAGTRRQAGALIDKLYRFLYYGTGFLQKMKLRKSKGCTASQ